MDKLTIFPVDQVSEVSLTSDKGNNLDTLLRGMGEIVDQLKMTHTGHEGNLWGKEVREKNL